MEEHEHLHMHDSGIPHTHIHENQKAVLNVLVQLAAVRSALNSVGKVILRDHIRHCIVDAAAAGDQEAIDNMCTALDKYL